MAQADLNVANQSGSAFRADLNNQLLALGTLMSGASAPSTTYAYMLWADTANGVLKIRNAANNAWITLQNLDGARTLIGTSTALTNAYAIATALTPALQIESSNANGASLSITRHTSAAANLLLQRGVTGTPVVADDAVGQIGFNGYDGTNYFNAALIRGVVDGTPGTGSMPGRLSLQTTPTGSTTPVERVRIDASGNINMDSGTLYVDATNNRVGIGNSSPVAALDVNGRIAAVAGTAGNPTLHCSADTNTGINLPESDRIQFVTGGVEAVRIDASQRVGIGTATPDASYRATIAGSRSGVGPGIYFLDTDASPNNYVLTINGNKNFVIRDQTNASDRFTIDTSGRLLVGTSNGQAQLTVWDTNTSFSTARIFKNAANTQSIAALLVDKVDNTSTTSQVFIGFTINNQATASGQINANGASQAAFGSWSDSRLKENIIDLPSQWSAIKSLRPVEFDYIESEGGGHQIGFIAQEVQEIYPDVVGERGDGMLTLSGMGKNESRLIKALQEAMERIEQLEAEMVEVKAQLS